MGFLLFLLLLLLLLKEMEEKAGVGEKILGMPEKTKCVPWRWDQIPLNGNMKIFYFSVLTAWHIWVRS